VADPVSVMVDTSGTGHVAESEIVKRVRDIFDMKPSGIITTLDLKRPQFRGTAAYGHFGRENEGFRWELTDKFQALK
jgi:S-adenosylmethionine synthetase